MGWLWGTDSKSSNAYDSLDPKLKEFLDRESPRQQQGQQSSIPSPSGTYAAPQARSPPSSSPPAPPAALPLPAATTSSDSTTATTVPSQSLYPDGRYSHLWATYQAPSQLSYRSSAADQAGTPSAQDHLTSLISTYRTRQADLSRAAVANCVEEQLAENDCWAGMGWSKISGMCRVEAREFARCCTLQARFLKAMGYMDVDAGDNEGAAGVEREARRREGMLARADEIWAEIRRRERAEEAARAAGTEMPVFAPLADFRSMRTAAGKVGVVGGTTGPAAQEMSPAERQAQLLQSLRPEKRAVVEKELGEMTPTERDIEVKLQLAEVQAKAGYGAKLEEYYMQEVEDRRARKDQGQSTLGDYLKALGGWKQ